MLETGGGWDGGVGWSWSRRAFTFTRGKCRGIRPHSDEYYKEMGLKKPRLYLINTHTNITFVSRQKCIISISFLRITLHFGEKNLKTLFKLYSVLKYLKAISIYAQTQTVSPEKLDFEQTFSQDFFFLKSFLFFTECPKGRDIQTPSTIEIHVNEKPKKSLLA